GRPSHNEYHAPIFGAKQLINDQLFERFTDGLGFEFVYSRFITIGSKKSIFVRLSGTRRAEVRTQWRRWTWQAACCTSRILVASPWTPCAGLLEAAGAEEHIATRLRTQRIVSGRRWNRPAAGRRPCCGRGVRSQSVLEESLGAFHETLN